jgi:hypothetical protein
MTGVLPRRENSDTGHRGKITHEEAAEDHHLRVRREA